MKITAKRLAIATSLFCIVHPLALSAQDAEEPYDIATVTCSDVMILSGMDRDTTLAFIHGFIVGTSGESAFMASKLADATDGFLEACIANPTDLAVATMRAAVEE